MKYAHWLAMGLGSALLGCGGIARLGATGEEGGSREYGGATTDGGNAAGGDVGSGGRPSGGAGGRPRPFSGGRSNAGAGGRASGGMFGTGGRTETGGTSFGGASTGGRVFDAGSDPARNRVPPGQVCDRFTTIQCAGDQYCCPSAKSFDACKQAMANACGNGFFLDQISVNPAVAYDIDRAEAAFSEFEKRASVCDPTVTGWALSNAGFRGIARGTLPLGAPCMTSDGGHPFDALALIASCADPEVNACNSTPGAGWTCMPRGLSGSSCLTDMNCREGLFCSYVLAATGRCAPKKANGETCTTLLDCESYRCDYTNNAICSPPTAETTYCLPY